MPGIKMFSNYVGKENYLSNACGFVLKTLYSENPNLFEIFIQNIIIGDLDRIGVSFETQSSIRNAETMSIADVLIAQPAYNIAIEAKLTDWFYPKQIENYIRNFKEDKSGSKNILVLLSSSFKEETLNWLEKFQSDGITFGMLTFDDFITKLKTLKNISYHLQQIIVEFEDFLGEYASKSKVGNKNKLKEDLLQTWKYKLDVVNATRTYDEILETSYYVCPNTGGTYKHQRCRYFAPYKNKQIDTIFEIEDIFIFEKDSGVIGSFYGTNISSKKIEKTKEDISKLFQRNKNHSETADKYQMQVFKLKNQIRLEKPFRKNLAGGMYGSKIYFTFEKDECKDIETLAKTISGKAWEEFRK